MNKDLVVKDSLEVQIADDSKKRSLLNAYVKKNMKEGTDFYSLTIGGKKSKPSLSKPGSEKFMSLFHFRAEFTKDADTWEMLGSPAGTICYICKLYSVKGGVLVGEGRGARDAKRDGGDVNKAIKMAEKSAQIDAILRTGALSDLFTQDLEDMGPSPELPLQPVRKATPAQVSFIRRALEKEDISPDDLGGKAPEEMEIREASILISSVKQGQKTVATGKTDIY